VSILPFVPAGGDVGATGCESRGAASELLKEDLPRRKWAEFITVIENVGCSFFCLPYSNELVPHRYSFYCNKFGRTRHTKRFSSCCEMLRTKRNKQNIGNKGPFAASQTGICCAEKVAGRPVVVNCFALFARCAMLEEWT
jgi:hypothetical protein